MTELIETDYLLLRKVPYGEGDLIVNGITPKQGKVGFLIYGALTAGKRRFPHFDLFRHLQLRYTPGKGELQKCQDSHLVEDFSGVAGDYHYFQGACWLARFALDNVLPGVDHEHFFFASCRGLRSLAARRIPVPAILSGICLVYLYEAGWLSDYQRSPQTVRQCQQLIDMAMGLAEAPSLTERNWQEIFAWCKHLLLQSECAVPQD
jgi:recombinational DNA repair protein (RecF pathway)